MFSTVGYHGKCAGYIKDRGNVQYHEGYDDTYVGITSITWRMFSTVGDLEDVSDKIFHGISPRDSDIPHGTEHPDGTEHTLHGVNHSISTQLGRHRLSLFKAYFTFSYQFKSF